MEIRTLIEALGYDRSASFLDRKSLLRSLDFAHIFRKAIDNCALHGVYLLADNTSGTRNAPTPVVYVAEAATEEAAANIHRLVWNQGIVPFLIVRTPIGVRVYSGFAYSRDKSKTDASHTGILEALIGFNDIVERLADFRADAIDDGLLWKTRGAQMDPRRRVDWLLLDNLQTLAAMLVKQEGIDRPAAHALIGKFVYLRYLRDRDILSQRKLAEWDLTFEACLGRKIAAQGFARLNRYLDEWLNGAVFPLAGHDFETRHVQLVADVFLGDTPTGQLHLNFEPYDFSYIPIETLSVIYEQFLASENQASNGAFYTPIPVVNFILNEVEDRSELTEGVKVLDPSCGSGAFLVQCYRRLVERTILKTNAIPGPLPLRALLTKSIFGVDRDGDACRIAELSLLLTMLDYINPPDLHNTRFKLPTLRGTNIYECDFFDEDSEWAARRQSKFDVVIGNPPWVEASSSDKHTHEWMKANRNSRPVVENQTAEAFLWQASEYLSDEGTAGFLIPAATLFKDSSAFRRAFFERHHVASVANLASFRRVLFRNVEAASAAIVYGKTGDKRQPVYTFSPLLANQEAARSPVPGKRRDIWSISVNASEVQALERSELSKGGSLPWKVAMWGSVRDLRLLQRLARDFSTLGALETDKTLWMSEGLQLRQRGDEDTDEVPEAVGKSIVNTKALKHCERIFSFPAESLDLVPSENGYARKGRRDIPLSVCRPPHIVVAASGNFFVFTDQFIVVPPRWIGIAGTQQRADLLRALSVYLSSYVVTYHQFFISSQQGIRDGRLQLATLRRVPVPRGAFEGRRLKEWTELHRALAANEEQARSAWMSDARLSERRAELLLQVNELAYKALGLRDEERCLVRDFVEVKIGLSDGVLRPEALRAPSRDELARYANRLASSLDGFLGDERRIAHRTCIAYSPHGAAVEVKTVKRTAANGTGSLVSADAAMHEQLQKRARLSHENAQWLYFDRNLFVSRGDSVFIFKPMQRTAWTETQALLDADELIANTLLGGET